MEVAGSVGGDELRQSGPNCVKVGVIPLETAMVMVEAEAQLPAAGVKV